MTDSPNEDSLWTVFSGGTVVFLGKFVMLGMGFFTQLLIARWLTGASYGAIVLAISILDVTSQLGRIGLDRGVLHILPEHEDDPEKVSGVVSATLRVAAVSGILGGAALYLAAPVLSTRIFSYPDLTELLRIVAIAIPFNVLGFVAIAIARAAADAKVHVASEQLFKPVLRFVLIALLLFFGLGAQGVAIGHALALVLFGLSALLLMHRFVPSYADEKANMYRPVVWYSLPLVVTQSTMFLTTHADKYLLGYYLDPTAVGVYNIAFLLQGLVPAIGATLAFVLPPTIARLNRDGKSVEMNRLYQVTTKWMTFLSIPVFIPLFFFPTEFIQLTFGAAYTDAAFTLQILAVGGLFSLMSGVNNPILIALGRRNYVILLSALVLGLNLVLNVILIPRYGIVGAGVASVIAIWVEDVLSFAVLNRKYGLFPFRRAQLVPMAGVLVIVTAIVRLTSASMLVSLAIIGPVILVVALLLGAVEADDFKLLDRFEHETGVDLALARRLLHRFVDRPKS